MSHTFDITRSEMEAGIAEGLHYGGQIYVSARGETLADFAVGESRAGVPMSTGSLNLWMSSTKPVGAVAIGQLWERGLLEIDDPVARHVPEFGRNGKEGVTIRHLLTHTGGFRTPPRGPLEDWPAVIAELCAARLEPGWVPGRKAGYHPASSWYVLAEVVRRADGRDYSRYVREMIFEPLGMRDSWVGMPSEVFAAYGERVAPMWNTTSHPPAALDAEKIATSCQPGGGGWGPIRELGLFYEMLLSRGKGVLRSQTVEALTARHRAGMFDVTFKSPMDWGLGFLLNMPTPAEALPYGYGPVASPRTFGHGGSQSSGGFCDPERGLVVAYVFNGMCGELLHQARRKALLAALEEDLRNWKTSRAEGA